MIAYLVWKKEPATPVRRTLRSLRTKNRSYNAVEFSVVYSTDRSKAVVPVLVLLFVALWLFYEAICFMSYLVLFCSCFFQSF